MKPLSLHDLEKISKIRLPPPVYDLFAGGADDERTLGTNRSEFQNWALLPRVLRGVESTILQKEILKREYELPFVVAPTAFHRLASPGGELDTARATKEARIPFTVSMASTTAIEEISENYDSPWFQLYLQPDLEFTQRIIERVEAAGCSAIVLTVDSPVFGNRERDLRNGFMDLPQPLVCENMRDPAKGKSSPPRSIEFKRDLSWKDIDWLRAHTRLPIILKGILHPKDALLAVEHGASAVWVSNHGGRQLDGAISTLVALPQVREALQGRIPLIVDGGIRRGTDVIIALALGADFVALGRPILWGLSYGGKEGVLEVLSILEKELRRGLTLLGCDSLDGLSEEFIRSSRGNR